MFKNIREVKYILGNEKSLLLLAMLYPVPNKHLAYVLMGTLDWNCVSRKTQYKHGSVRV